MVILSVERAPTGRATCKISMEPIDKGEYRVSMDGWAAGRVVQLHSKPMPFLKSVTVDRCARAGSTCKATGHKFVKGDIRVGLHVGSSTTYITPEAAADVLRPAVFVAAASGAGSFDASKDLQGLDALSEEERDKVLGALRVLEEEVEKGRRAGEDREENEPSAPPTGSKRPRTAAALADAHPAPSPATATKGAAAAAAAAAGAAKEDVKEEDEEEEERPAKKKRGGAGKGRASKGVKEEEAPVEGKDSTGSTPAPKRAARAARAATPYPLKAEPKAEVKEEEAEEEEGEDEEDQGLTAYELRRLEIIAKNRERMAALDIPDIVAGLAAAVKPQRASASQRGVTAKKQRALEQGPPRRSSRILGSGPDPNFASGLTDDPSGTLVKVEGEWIRVKQPVGGFGTEAAPKKVLEGDLECKATNLSPEGDAYFLRCLREQMSGGASCKSDKAARDVRPLKVGDYKRLALTEKRVAKVVKNGIPHVAFHPRTDAIMLAAGDKDGQVSIWHVDHEKVRPAGGDGTGDTAVAAAAAAENAADGAGPALGAAAELDKEAGVAVFDIHSGYISGMRFTGDGLASRLFTASYDGSVRCLDVTAGKFLEVYRSADFELSAMDVSSDGRSVWIADKEGQLAHVDVASASLTGDTFHAHSKKVNTVSVEPLGGRLVATAGTDTVVQVWDVRKLGKKAKPLETLEQPNSVQSAYFCPDGSGRLLTTCYDDTLRIYSPEGVSDKAPAAAKRGKAAAASADPSSAPLPTGYSQTHRIRHDNQTGRWIIPFRAIWGAAGDVAIVGGMKRPINVFSADTGSHVCTVMEASFQTAISSRHAAHASLPVLAACTGSGRAHVYALPGY